MNERENVIFSESAANSDSMEMKYGRDSFFDGSLIELILFGIGCGLMTFFSLGILYPWALCLLFGWKIDHTVVDGKRMHFSGSAMGLFGNWIKWLALSIVTLGIYSFWVCIKLEDWKAKNTSFIN